MWVVRCRRCAALPGRWWASLTPHFANQLRINTSARPRTGTHTHVHTPVLPLRTLQISEWHETLALSPLTVATFHSRGSMCAHCCLSVSHLRPVDRCYDALCGQEEYGGSGTITLCVRTERHQLQRLSRQKIKTIPLIYRIGWADVRNWNHSGAFKVTWVAST